MLLPRRYNPVRVVIKKISKASTYIDPDFGTPMQTTFFGAPIEMEAQVNLGNKKFNMLYQSQSGDIEDTKGHLVFLKRIMDEKGWIVEKGDRIIEIGPVGSAYKVDFEIREVRPESPRRGDFLLVYAEFGVPKQRQSIRRD